MVNKQFFFVFFFNSLAVLKGKIFQSIRPSLLFLGGGLGAALLCRHLWFEADGTQCLELRRILTVACWNGCDLLLSNFSLTHFF